MKPIHKLFLLTQAAVVIAMLSISIMQPVEAADEVTEERTQEHCKHCGMGAHKHVKVHIDYYYELLAEKFAPDELAKWQSIRKERDLLFKKLKEAKKRDKLTDTQAQDEAWLKNHKDIQIAFKDAVEKRDEKQIKILLPQLFEQYRQMNEHLKKRLDDIK